MPRKPCRKPSLGRKNPATKRRVDWEQSQDSEDFHERDAKRKKIER